MSELRYGRDCQSCGRLLRHEDRAFCKFCRQRLTRIRDEEGRAPRLPREELRIST